MAARARCLALAVLLVPAALAPAALAQEPAPGRDPAAATPAPDETTVVPPRAAGDYPLYPDPGRPVAIVPEHVARPPEQVVAGLSSDAVAITASFDGSDILIYGAIKRETPIPGGSPLAIIVTIEGPSQALTVRRKSRRLGIWVNSESVHVGAAPSFYVVATSAPLRAILTPDYDTRFRISVPLAMRAFAGEDQVDDPTPFTEALIRLREQAGIYRLDEGSVQIAEQTLFRADIRLPANLIEGEYKTRIFLLREGEVVDVYRAPIEVHKVGLERWLYRLALDRPFLYGIMSLAVAVACGWGASAAFRALRRN